MGMNFSPMYQPVSTKTIKADGDLNIDPYDLIAVDGKFDTVEADEFVGGVGNFSNIVMPTLSYSGYYDGVYKTSGVILCWTIPIFSSPFPVSGKVSVKYASSITIDAKLYIVSSSGATIQTVTKEQQEFNVVDALNIYVLANSTAQGTITFTIGTPVLTYS